ncbi:unnamed protein product [Choristocarpus tenellus]
MVHQIGLSPSRHRPPWRGLGIIFLSFATFTTCRYFIPWGVSLTHFPQDLLLTIPTARVAVVVMPSPPVVSGPSTRIERLTTIQETWGGDFLLGGRGKNRLVIVMDESESETAGALMTLWDAEEPHFLEYQNGGKKKFPSWDGSLASGRVLLVPGEFSVNGDTRMKYVLEQVHALHDPDFLFFCNEHTFLIPENLQCFVDNLEPSKPVYLGHRFRKKGTVRKQADLNSGAAGFILSRSSLSLLHSEWGRFRLNSGGEPRMLEADGIGRVEGDHLPAQVCVASTQWEKDNPGVFYWACMDWVWSHLLIMLVRW